jgi:hypothetical protein
MAAMRDWLDEGGVLLFMPRRLISRWTGCDGGDYSRACANSYSWVSRIDVAEGGEALVLGGEPAMTLLTTGPDGTLTIVRWIHADDEEALIAFALRREAGNVCQSEPDLAFDNTEASWVLFDASANPAVDNPQLRVAVLPLGGLVVDTAYLEHGPNAAVVHRVRPATGIT